MNGPAPALVALAELIVDLVPHADWCIFAKNGTDATQIFATGSFWCGAVPMAAALATLTELRRIDGPAHMKAMGERLRAGLAERARRHGVAIDQSGPPQMPTLLFADDPEWKKGFAFCAEALRHGAYFHPKHNMFLSCAHTEADIDRAPALRMA